MGEAIGVGSPRRLFKKLLRRQGRVGVFYLIPTCCFDLRVAPEKSLRRFLHVGACCRVGSRGHPATVLHTCGGSA